MDGLFNVLKPPGMTSHDVVAFMRRITGTRRVGHTGTLDPGAAGLLLTCCGKATRLIEYLDHDKKYRAQITFGVESSTGDGEGELTRRGIPGGFSRMRVEEILSVFSGEIDQVPPMTSAVKHKGRRLYELARRGETVIRAPRRVKIYSISILRWYEDPLPRAILDIACSAGTYIRVLCQDIGEAAGSGAYMSFLLRTGVGQYSIQDAHTLEELAGMAGRGELAQALAGVDDMLSFLPSVEVRDSAIKSILSGSSLYRPGVVSVQGKAEEGDLVVLRGGGVVLALARVIAEEKGILFKPEKVLA